MKNLNVLIFLMFLSVYVFFSIGHFGGDGYQDYLTAESIVLDGNLSINDRPDDVDEIKYDTRVGRQGKDGKFYSARPTLGVPILLSAFYAAGHFAAGLVKGVPHDYVTMLAASFLNPFFSALNALLVFLIGRRMRFSAALAFGLSVIYAFATMAPVYARTGFSEPVTLCFMLLSVYCLFLYREKMSLSALICAAFALAFMLFCKIQAILLVPAVLLYLAWVIYDERTAYPVKIAKMLLFCSILLIPVGLMALINVTLFQKVLSFGGADAGYVGKRIMTADHFLKGMYYYLFSTGKGFFLFNVPLVLIFFSLDKSLKDRKKELLLFALIFVPLLFFYAKSFRRGSLFSWGPRYLLFAVPFLTLLLGDFARKFSGLRGKLALVVLSITGFFIALPCMLVNQSRFYKFVVEKLKLDEYMINFIPDLSPVKGAWSLAISGFNRMFTGNGLNFIYEPDYWLAKKLSEKLDGYDGLDIWFIKVLEIKPDMHNLISGLVAVLFVTFAASLAGIIVLLKGRSANEN